jgi:HlyD family secretion protein
VINHVIAPRRVPVISGKIISAVLVVALFGSVAGIYRYREMRRASSAGYATTTVQQGTVTSAVSATGPISASSAVPVNFKSSGKLATVDVKIGDQVKAGQVLATLDPSDLQAQLQQAQATLASAQANYNKVVQGPTGASLAPSQAAIQAAQTQLASAQAALTQAQAVAQKDVAAAQQTVANDQQALADAQKTAQALPAVLAQNIQQAKDKLYADQVADDAAVGRGSMTKEARQAALDADQAAIDQANASAQQQITQSQQTVNQVQQALNTAQANLASSQAKDAQSVQQAQASVASAQAALTTAQANYTNAAQPATQADIDAAKAQVANAQAGVTLAQNNLDAATLTAPTGGTVTAVNGAVGQWLAGGATSGSAAASASGSSTSSSTISSDFIDITSLSGLQITAQVNEADIGKVQVGQPITFTVDSFPGKTFSGKVSAIQPLGQTSSNVVSYSVISTIDPTSATLLPGMTATVNIITQQAQNALEVPASALAYAKSHANQSGVSVQPGGSGVLIELQNGSPVTVPVQFGISDGTHVQVVSGVQAGDQIVTGGGTVSTTTASAPAKASANGTSRTSNPLVGGGPGGPPPGA